MKARQLIIYFSASGTTKRAAQELQSLTGAEIFELTPAGHIPTTYEEWGAWGKEQLDQYRQPAIKSLPDLANYQTIFLGFPTWWQQPPMIVHSFFNAADLTDKKIVPFTTSMSTPLKDSLPVLEQLIQAAGAHLLPGLRYTNPTELKRFLAANPDYFKSLP